MDKRKIEQLKERRLLLQAEVRFKTLRDRISIPLKYLEEQGFEYTIYYEHEHLDWINANVNLRKRDGYKGLYDYQIEVDDDTENCTTIYCSSEDSLLENIREQFLAIQAKDSNVIVCHDGGDPEMEISMEALLSKPSMFLSEPETWILFKDRSWIIEYIGEQEIIRFIQLQNKQPVLIRKVLLEQEKE